MKIIVAVTGASGAIYARRTLEQLIGCADVEQIALIVSEKGKQVVQYEREALPHDKKITLLDNNDMFASVASGSAGWDAMIVVPASMGSVARIATGISQSLIERAADVMLKERRRLIAVVREAPYSLIHLRNMTSLTEAGATILPASPSFYAHPTTITEAVDTIVERVICLAGIKTEHFSWGEEQ